MILEGEIAHLPVLLLSRTMRNFGPELYNMSQTRQTIDSGLGSGMIAV